MKRFQEFLAIIKKNRYFLFAIIGIIIFLQILSKGAEPSVTRTPDTHWEQNTDQTPNITNQQDNSGEGIHQGNNISLTTLFLLAICVLGIVVAKKRGYIEKLYPSVFIFRTKYYKQKSTGHLVIKVEVINKTKSDISLKNPSICFYHGKENREFMIKNIGGQNYFPLTLMPNTGQKFVIDAQKFYDNVQGLIQFKTIQMKICSLSGKCYKSGKWKTYLTFKTIK